MRAMRRASLDQIRWYRRSGASVRTNDLSRGHSSRNGPAVLAAGGPVAVALRFCEPPEPDFLPVVFQLDESQQHRLNFLPEPQGHGSLRPILVRIWPPFVG